MHIVVGGLFGESSPGGLFAALNIGVLTFEFSLDLLGAEPEIAQARGAVLLELGVALSRVLLEAAIVRDDLRDTAILDLVEQRYGTRSTTRELDLVRLACPGVLLVRKDAPLERICSVIQTSVERRAETGERREVRTELLAALGSYLVYRRLHLVP